MRLESRAARIHDGFMGLESLAIAGDGDVGVPLRRKDSVR